MSTAADQTRPGGGLKEHYVVFREETLMRRLRRVCLCLNKQTLFVFMLICGGTCHLSGTKRSSGDLVFLREYLVYSDMEQIWIITLLML